MTDKPADEMPKLRPCPFCGGDGIEANSSFEGQLIVCSFCLAKTRNCGNFKLATEAWNTRAQPDILTTIRQYAAEGWNNKIVELIDGMGK